MPVRFCIVTPSYNTRRYLGACIDSVLVQKYPHLDYLIMDGGSTDGSVELLKSYGDGVNVMPGSPRWISARDKGQSDAINRGFAQTSPRTGDEILGWLNSDDTLAPGTLKHVAGVFEANPDVDVVYGQATYIDARGKHISRCTHIEPFDRYRLLHISDFIVQPATFFRRRAFDAVGGVDVSLNWMMDWDLWIKFAKRGLKFVHTPRVLAHFRWLSENKTASGGTRRLDEIDACLARHGLPRPAFVQLERCHTYAVDAVKAATRGKLIASGKSLGQIATTLIKCPNAAFSLLHPHTWSVIWTGQVLRARAAAADRRREA
ncbi:glycosyltransferase family 2 protein [Humisphaera borealis]|uniref:Glycosyltransferase n=1 Tax=Humisphaera borealis TaxID=2807512 RepID=A0A7M2X0B5_9BACT|nr:glycosyltransferase family 2 protein [Humisphaera borealis]QOV90852.1 glycosyltransferase [Humisphaera borealis]